MLEKTFTPSLDVLSTFTKPPCLPRRAPLPTPIGVSAGARSHCADLSDAYEIYNQDSGIDEYCIKTVTLWGDVVSYIQAIRRGNSERPWQVNSVHTQLNVKLYELETHFSHAHLLRNVAFADRPISDLRMYREYWAPWILTQITSHATQAAMNNPFIHLVALRDDRAAPQPRSFLQTTVDKALFHSSWVARMAQMCIDLSFDIWDPLIGHAVAATATIAWIFQFARDDKISSRSKANLVTYELVLSRLAGLWPHIARKVSKKVSTAENYRFLANNSPSWKF